MKLKVCGMKYPDNIVEVAHLQPDFMGFIFYPGSKRFVGGDFKIPDISSAIMKVGVFVNESVEKICELIEIHGLDYVQLHGEETPQFCRDISQEVRVIKAFTIDESTDFFDMSAYEDCCTYFLFDSKSESRGGSGRSFDQAILKNYKLSTSYFLAGGIDALPSSDITPFALDVNSKFEIEPGLKDIRKLKELRDEISG